MARAARVARLREALAYVLEHTPKDSDVHEVARAALDGRETAIPARPDPSRPSTTKVPQPRR